ncbi:MAG: putative caspase-like protein [bacterium]|jgi:uncharacterized caspase-like protein
MKKTNNMFINVAKMCVALICFTSFSVHSLAIEKRALVIGVGNYGEDSEWSETHGDNDAKAVEASIKTIGFNNTIKLVNNQASKKSILRHLNTILDSCKKGDIVLFYFAGHGQLVVDYNGDELD